jgi:hypothetical protein
MTLSSIRTDLRRVFSPGQAYVALSRVRRLEDLTLEGLPPEKMFTPDHRVLGLEFSLREAQQPESDRPKKRRRTHRKDSQTGPPEDAVTADHSILRPARDPPPPPLSPPPVSP